MSEFYENHTSDGRCKYPKSCELYGCNREGEYPMTDPMTPTPDLAALVDVDWLAQEIRRVDGNHDLGAGALAERLHDALVFRLGPVLDGVHDAGYERGLIAPESNWMNGKARAWDQGYASRAHEGYGNPPTPNPYRTDAAPRPETTEGER